MFQPLRGAFESIRDFLETKVSELFGGREQPQEIGVAPSSDPVIDADQLDQVEEEEWDDEPEDIEDVDEEADDFQEYLDSLDDLEEADEIAEEIRSIRDYDGDPRDIRKARYLTQEEAQHFLDKSGLSAFAEVLYIEDEELFTIAVHDSPGGKRK